MKNLSTAFHTSSSLLEISKTRFFAGIILSFCCGFTCYSLLYLFREIIIFYTLQSSDLLSLFKVNRSFWNLIFGFVAGIFAQNICFGFWLDRPRRLTGKRKYLKTNILVDQKALSWNVYMYCSELIFAFLFIGFFFQIIFFDTFSIISILIIVTLFLQSWTTLRRLEKKKSIKWMLISAILITSVAFFYSSINLIDHKIIESISTKDNMYINYDLQLPTIINPTKSNPNTYSPEIQLIHQVKDDQETTLIFIESEPIQIDSFSDRISKIAIELAAQSNFSKFANLQVDRRLKLKFIDQIKSELHKQGITRLRYGVLQPDLLQTAFFDENLSYAMFNSKSQPNMREKDTVPFDNALLHVEVKSKTEISINDESIHQAEFQQALRSELLKNGIPIISYSYSSELEFQTYIQTHAQMRAVIAELRNEMSLEIYTKPFQYIDRTKQYEIVKKSPFIVLEKMNKD